MLTFKNGKSQKISGFSVLALKESGAPEKHTGKYKGMTWLKAHQSMAWRHQAAGTEGHVILFGVNIFEYGWHTTGQRISAKDP